MRQLRACAAIAVFALIPLRSLASPELVRAQCLEGVDPDAVRCGTLSVPVDYQAPNGRQIDLYDIVIPAVQQRPGMVPLVPLAGGPGNSITDSAEWYLDEETAGFALRRDRPVVLVDQRGTGRSNPLHCTSLEARHPFDRFYPADDVRQCRDTLARQNDLEHFGTLVASRDLERVREALGFDRIDLWALSYGTVLAQVYLRDHPERVRSAVLVGTAPLDGRSPLYHAANAQSCVQWPQSSVPESFFDPVRSDVPVLLLAGDLDHVTPPAWSYQVARGFSRARVVTMPHGGHLFWDWGDGNDSGACFDAIAVEFYARGDAQALDTQCAERAMAGSFFVPGVEEGR